MSKGTATCAALLMAAAMWFIHKLHVLATRMAPVGYEDEEGFHYGDPT